MPYFIFKSFECRRFNEEGFNKHDYQISSIYIYIYLPFFTSSEFVIFNGFIFYTVCKLCVAETNKKMCIISIKGVQQVDNYAFHIYTYSTIANVHY